MAQAIARAKAALAEHPDQYGGWQMLADWHTRAGQLQNAVAAAEKMAALAPLEAVALGYLGDLKLRSGDKDGAQAAFERAFSLDPGYFYAGSQLFHMHLDAKRFDEAAQLLQVMERSGESPQTLYCGVCLAAKREDIGSAFGTALVY